MLWLSQILRILLLLRFSVLILLTPLLCFLECRKRWDFKWILMGLYRSTSWWAARLSNCGLGTNCHYLASQLSAGYLWKSVGQWRGLGIHRDNIFHHRRSNPDYTLIYLWILRNTYMENLMVFPATTSSFPPSSLETRFRIATQLINRWIHPKWVLWRRRPPWEASDGALFWALRPSLWPLLRLIAS